MCETATQELPAGGDEVLVLSAPSSDDLKLGDSDYALFQKLIEWQERSEDSQIVLGKPLCP